MKRTFIAQSLICERLFVAFLLVLLFFQAAQPAVAHGQADKGSTNIIGPAGSVAFGTYVTVLPNGNFVVVDPSFTQSSNTNLGAVYLYNGATKTLISTLIGSHPNDFVGNNGVTVLQDGNFLVKSPNWKNGAAANAGAVTWCSAVSGCPAAISASNSLIGTQLNDLVGYNTQTIEEGNIYIVQSPYWNNGTASIAGAITFCRTNHVCNGAVSSSNSLVGSTINDKVGDSSIYHLPGDAFIIRTQWVSNGGALNAGAVRFCSAIENCSGSISASNSLIGTTTNDRIGDQITVLSDGDYIVRSPFWDNGTMADAGAVSYCSGTSGCFGGISTVNSLLGEHTNDQVGSNSLPLNNGGYALLNPNWDRGLTVDAGAATWCSTNGCTGYITESNSVVGSSVNDKVGYNGIKLSSTGDYLILSPFWDDEGTTDVGAATWCDDTTGRQGEISSTNSLVGSQAGDGIGLQAIASFDVNNYMVMWPNWDLIGTANVGAVQWCSANSGCVGEVSSISSLVGSNTNDQVGIFVSEMGAGRYVINSYNWSGTATGAGAVTLCNQMNGCPGIVSSSNSLVGSTAGDHVGLGSLNWNANGDLLISHNTWHYCGAASAGAITFCKSSSTCVGTVSVSNSLVGTQENDGVGKDFRFLSNGNYIVASTDWHGVGAVTLCSGTSGCTGPVSAANSLTGSNPNDQIGYNIRELSNGNYVVVSPHWNNGAIEDAGAATWCSATSGCQGVVSSTNSLVGSSLSDGENLLVDTLDNQDYLVFFPFWDAGGTVDVGRLAWCAGNNGCSGPIANFPRSVGGVNADGGWQIRYAYDLINNQLVVGRPMDNIVTVLSDQINYRVFLPIVKR